MIAKAPKSRPLKPYRERLHINGPQILTCIAEHLAGNDEIDTLDGIVQFALLRYVEFLKRPLAGKDDRVSNS
jgi:hypothetical protein